VSEHSIDFASLNAWADKLISTARRAGDEILKIYATDFEVMQKADASPVTIADQRAEAVIVADLEKLTPRFPIVAEEQVAAHGVPTFDGDNFWLVDALDGTREFIKKGPEFTVNIALVHGGLPVLGIVFAPVPDEMYVGVVDEHHGKHRAEIWRAGIKTSIACRARPANPAVAGSKTHETSDNMKNFWPSGALKIGLK
jgi:3'(2'), 5'-bisphosphate nucleotidase